MYNVNFRLCLECAFTCLLFGLLFNCFPVNDVTVICAESSHLSMAGGLLEIRGDST